MAKNNNLKDFVTGVANAIRNKKKTTNLINPQDFETEIETIQTGTDTSNATATADDIRLNKTAYVANGKVTGTIEDYDGSSEPASGKSLFAQLVDKSITEVSASDLAGVRKIGNHAFNHCSSLTSITIPNSVTSIGNNAFSYCNHLKSITILGNVASIEYNAFYECSSLESITILGSVTSIGNQAFSSCSNLINITIPDGVTSIGNQAFSYCIALTSITIGKSATSINTSTFFSCGIATESGTTYTFLPTTPPTIQSNTFKNAKINKIIVPIGTADTYKAATNWSALADYIQEAEA